VVRSSPIRDGHPEQPQLLHLLDDRLRELVLVVVLLGDRDDLLVHELAHHLGDRALLVGLLGVRRGDGQIGLLRGSLTGESV
jgi:hypothetical protein